MCVTDVLHCISNIWSIRYQYVINMISIFDQYVINMLSVSYQYMINMQSICYQYGINMLSVCYQYVINILSIYELSMQDISHIMKSIIYDEVITKVLDRHSITELSHHTYTNILTLSQQISKLVDKLLRWSFRKAMGVIS